MWASANKKVLQGVTYDVAGTITHRCWARLHSAQALVLEYAFGLKLLHDSCQPVRTLWVAPARSG